MMNFDHGHDCTIVNGVSRIGYMNGGKSALWDDTTMCDVFVEQAKNFIDDAGEQPFFLYHALHQPHVPRIPAPRFVGSTTLGPRGDVIVELDWCVGQVLDHLETKGLRDNTIVIFSSDNGPVLNDGYHDEAVEKCGDHSQAGPLRGGKYSLYDGGTRVPFILSWPAQAAAGVESEALVCQTDFYASFSSLLSLNLDDDEALDSENIMTALMGKSDQGRRHLVTEGMYHNTVLRTEDWVFIPPYEGESINKQVNIETGNSNKPQLFNLDQDIAQVKNIAEHEPELVSQMNKALNGFMQSSKSRGENLL
jgi:arylsulfatase A-like enzyme